MTNTLNENTAKEIQSLININKDACEFYESAAEKVESPELQKTFSSLKAVHNGVVVNLQSCIAENFSDTDIEADGTVKGKATKFWGELMSKVSNDVDETLVTHLEEAEDRCLHSMQEAINDSDVSVDVKLSLKKEMGTLRKTHDYVKAIKDYMKAA